METYKNVTEEDLNKILSDENSKETTIREFFRLKNISDIVESLIKKTALEYDTLYPKVSEDGKEKRYIVYNSKDELDEDGNILNIHDYYDVDLSIDEDGNVTETLTIREEFEGAEVIPSKKLYIDDAILKVMEDDTVTSLNTNLYIEFIKPILKERISKLADEKSESAEAYLAGKESISLKQVERYRRKYDLAVKCKTANDFTLLDTEANLVGITGAELADLIIAQGDAWNIALDNFYALIEAYRVRANAITDSITTLDEVSTTFKLLEESKSFNADTTPADVEAVFANL